MIDCPEMSVRNPLSTVQNILEKLDVTCFGDSGLGLAVLGLVQSDPICRGPIRGTYVNLR
jgi:hypothetical protein